MRKISFKLSAASCALALLVLSGTPVLALADSGSTEDDTNTSTSDGTPEDSTAHHDNTANLRSSATAADLAKERQARLSTARLKICQNRQKVIDNIMTRVAERGQRRLDLFTTIAMRVEKFYTNKGKTLSNYDALVAEVNAKQASAQTAVAAVKSASTGFSCDGTDPVGSITSFKTSLNSEITALKAYRTAIRNLIVGVKSVVGTSDSDQTNREGNQ